MWALSKFYLIATYTCILFKKRKQRQEVFGTLIGR